MYSVNARHRTVSLVVAAALVASGGLLTLPTTSSANASSLDGIPASAPLTALAIAVADAQNNNPVPSALVPTIATASSSGVNLGKCSQYPTPTGSICNLGAPAGTKTLVVFGNSHSTMWVPAITRIAKAEGWKVYPIVREECAYEIYPNLGKKWDPLNVCTKFYNWATATIKRLRPDVIIMGSYDLTKQWIAGEKLVVRQLKPLTKRFILLGDYVAGKSPARCLTAPGATLGMCAKAEPRYSLETQAQSIATSTKVNFLNVRPLFCENKICPAVIHGIIPTTDGAHLTTQFAIFLAPALAQALNLGGTHTIAFVPVALTPGSVTTTTTSTTTTTTTTTSTLPAG
jgi:hypothetical protein